MGSAVRLSRVASDCGAVGRVCSAGLDEESGRRAFMCDAMYSADRLCCANAPDAVNHHLVLCL